MSRPRFYELNGVYIGGFAGEAVPPPGAIEVPERPAPPVLTLDALAELLVEKKVLSQTDIDGKKK